MSAIPRVLPGERVSFFILALLLYINGLALNSNEVVATTGFISSIGAEQILLVWAADMVIIIITSGVYSLVVDRTRREKLAVGLFFGFSVIYILLYILFFYIEPTGIPYLLLLVLNDQQWLLFPLVIWTLGSDLFSLDQAKRLFPLLAAVALLGAVSGSSIAALAASVFGTPSFGLLLVNACLLALMGAIMYSNLDRMRSSANQSSQGEKMLEVLREGLAFVREVPVYRYLTMSMLLLGVALNAVEFELIYTAAVEFDGRPAELQTFYGTFRSIVIASIFVTQALLASRLLNRLGFKLIFGFLPGALVLAVVIIMGVPGIMGVAIGSYLTHVVLTGIDEPSRKAFQGLVPDERRGRVSAFIDGYLLPVGTIISCIFIGGILLLGSQQIIDPVMGRYVYLGVSGLCAVIALFAISRLYQTYDASMLNWRLRRRQTKSVLDKLDFS